MDLGGNRSLEPIAPFRYVNHSCDPNAELVGVEHFRHGPTGQLMLEACRDIATGEEIAIDYAWRAEDAIPCHCSSQNCRGWIVALEELRNIDELTSVSPAFDTAASAPCS
jgi:hypothetical protein